MAYTIGQFKTTDTGFKGTIDTLAVKAKAEFIRVLNRTNENAPAFEIFHGELRIGAAWERQGKKGKFLSVSFEDPSFHRVTTTSTSPASSTATPSPSSAPRPRGTSSATGRQQCRPHLPS